MRIHVTHGIDDLANDLAAIPGRAVKDMRDTVRQAAIVGNTVARDNARRTSGKHGKHYPKAFTWEMSSFYGFGGGTFQAEYGPDAARPQGSMATGFERGSRNQTSPHNDLANSADLMGPAFQGEVRRLPEKWFWQ